MLIIQPFTHRGMGMGTVVIGHRKLAQATSAGLLNQVNRVKTSIAAKGMAVEVERFRAAPGIDPFQNSPERMVHIRRRLLLI